LPVSDEGSGAWLGREALRQVLWAHDGRTAWSELLTALFRQFQSDPHAIVRFAAEASPREFGALAPLVVTHATQGDAIGCALMRRAGQHIDALAARLAALGAERLALVGGLGSHLEPWLAAATRSRLVQPAGDALEGAVALARAAAESLAA